MTKPTVRKYHHLITRVDYPRERGYRMEVTKLPDWMHLTITEDGDSKYLTVYSRLHVGKVFDINPTYNSEFTDNEIIKDLSGTIAYRFL